MINLKNISFKYKDKYILNSFNYTFKDTGLYALKGKSGSGKTTLLNLIGGFLEPSEGSITYSDDVKNVSNSTSLIFQENNLFDHLSVKDNIKLLCQVNNKTYQDNEILNILKDLNIAEYFDTYVSDISGGERQRVSIAIAILMDKKVILADEPFSSLDYDNSINIMNLFKELSKDRLIIFSSHNISLLDDESIIVLDLENEEYKTENELVLKEKEKKNNRISLRTFLYIYHKILGKRWILRTLSLLFFTALIFMLSFILCLTMYSKENVYIEAINKNNINNVYFTDKVDPLGMNYYRTGYGADFGIEELDYNAKYFDANPVGLTYIDESLGDGEIALSDYSLYNLRYYGIINFEKIEDTIGTKIKLYNKADNNNPFFIECTLVDIIKTPFEEKFSKNLDIDVHSKEFDYSYKIMRINSYTNYYFSTYQDATYLNDVEPGLIGIELKQERCSIIVCFQDTLAKNEIIVSKTFANNCLKNDIQIKVGKEYFFNVSNREIGPTIEFPFTIKDIVEEDTSIYNPFHEGIIYMSRETYMDFQLKHYMSGLNDRNVVIYGFKDANELRKIFNQIDMRYIDENRVIITNVWFYGVEGITKVFGEMDHMHPALEIACAVLLALMLFISIYSAYSLYMINKNRFQILEVYGMRRRNELFLLLLEFVIIIAISMLFALGIVIPSHMAFDKHLMNISNVQSLIPTFNSLWYFVSVLIVVLSVGLSVSGGYLLSLKRKIKSHISK